MLNKEKGLTRRQFITGTAGALGALAILASPFVPALKRARAADGTEEEGTDYKTSRAWCMVIDLKKCEGCVTINTPPQCEQACINMHFVPKGQRWIEVFQIESETGGGSHFMPVPCQQCENAPCVNVCPVAATYHSKEGIVLVDRRRCIGCRMCMGACPYQRRFFNWGTPELPPEAALTKYTPNFPVGGLKGTVAKCIFCIHLLVDGKLPACVVGCPMKALYMGDLNEDIGTNGMEVVKLSTFLAENDAFRYKEELGTQPRVWYLPGHGQNFGRKAGDGREMKPPVWNWGGEGFNRKVGVWPWGEASK